MRVSRSATPIVALSLLLLLGCGAAQPTASQATPLIQKPTAAAAAASPSAVQSGPAASPAVASPAARASASPRLAAAPAAQAGSGAQAVRLDPFAAGLEQPTDVVHAGDGSGRLFVVEKKGRIRIVRPDGAVEPTPFLDISAIVNAKGSEQGLLGLAFHPRFAQNGLFYVNYTDQVGIGNSVVARYQVSAADPNRADPNSAARLLYVEQPASNHNGGHLVFGPDGYLYIGFGDGGRAGDPWGNAQNKGVLLGKMLRIDVDGGSPYGIPPDNPFVNEPGARPEIWSYGLRNPWRYSFDRATGDLYIGHVGQNLWEWVDRQPAGVGGQNYGWNVIEGGHCFKPETGCDPSPYVLPIVEYSHDLGCSVTGGYVYRGPSFPRLQGYYLYGDYCSGRLWAAREAAPGQWQAAELLQAKVQISSFGEDEAGELYLAGLGDGRIYRVAAQ